MAMPIPKRSTFHIMSVRPLISVLVPCYNHEAFVIDSLESIKQDPYERIEILFLDDGSSDQSYDLAADWLETNKEHFENVSYARQENQGICKTFNTLVRRSSGDFVFILASDDQVATHGITNTVEYYLGSCKEPTLLFTDLTLIDYHGALYAESGTLYTHRDRELLEQSRQYLRLDTLINWGIPYMQQFYPRELFDRHGGYSELLKCEDYYFALKNMVHGTIAYAPVISRRYRMRPKDQVVTPGLSEADYRAGSAREMTASEFSPPYRVLFWALGLRDMKAEGKIAFLIKGVFRFLLKAYMKLARVYYRIKTAAVIRSAR